MDPNSAPPDRPVICQLVHSLAVGGAEILARQFAENCPDSFRTVFACLDELGTLGQELRGLGYRVEVIGRRPGFDRSTAHRLARFCRQECVSVIHAHQYAPFLYAAISRLPRRRPPILFTEHGRAFPDFRRRKRVWANRLLLGRRDRVIAVGGQVRDALVQNEGISPSRIDVIYNGIAVEQYQPDHSTRAAVRQELGMQEGEIAVFQVARLNPLKDHATAIRTMQRLIGNSFPAKLILVGDGELRAEIAGQIDSAGLEDHVVMLGQRGDVQRLLCGADVFLLTSVSEGIPLTLIEAMATGIPCVATDVGGIAEVVVDDETGLLAPAQDDARIAEHLARLATDQATRAAMGIAGRQRAVERFSDRQMHTAYHRLYCEITNLECSDLSELSVPQDSHQ